jgi:hypothetical protein
MKDLHRTIIFNPAGRRADLPENGLPGYGLQADVIRLTKTCDYSSCARFVVVRGGRARKNFAHSTLPTQKHISFLNAKESGDLSDARGQWVLAND